MDPDPPAVSADLTTSRFAELIACHDSEINRHQGLLIKDAEGKLVGTVTRGDVLRARDQDPSEAMTALEAGSRKLVVTYSDEILHEASARMLRNNIGRVPVVDREDQSRFIGYLGRPNIMVARLRRLDDGHLREPGWINNSKWRRSTPGTSGVQT